MQDSITPQTLKNWRLLATYTQAGAARAAGVELRRLGKAESGEIDLRRDELNRLRYTYIRAIDKNLNSVLPTLFSVVEPDRSQGMQAHHLLSCGEIAADSVQMNRGLGAGTSMHPK